MIIARIEQDRAALRRSERRVADFVLGRPSIVVESSIADVADSIGVSEPTVIRFCRAIGCVGFQDLKRQLARDLERRRNALESVRPAAKVGFPARIGQTIDRAVRAAYADLDDDSFDAALALICSAEAVVVWADAGDAAEAALLSAGLSATGIDARTGPPGPIAAPVTLVVALGDLAARAAAACARARAAGAKVLVVGRDAATAEVDALLPIDGSGLSGRAALALALEALRLAVEARLRPDSHLSAAAADHLQARKETAWADARRDARRDAGSDGFARPTLVGGTLGDPPDALPS